MQHNIVKGTLFIDQSQYLKSVLTHFGMYDCNPTIIPLPAGKQFELAEPDDHISISTYPYLEVIGSLTYAAMGTHPDICATVHALSPFAATFGPKHIMRYLCGTLNHGIMYTMGGGGLVGYMDANWANDTLNQWSVLGYSFLYAGGVVSWMLKQQSSAATSSMHAEYVATAEAAKELVWLCRFLLKVREDVSGPTTLFINNHTANLLTQNPVNHSVMKHIDVHYHFIQDCITDRSINLLLIGSNDMAADIMTKSLAWPKHNRFCLMMGMETVE